LRTQPEKAEKESCSAQARLCRTVKSMETDRCGTISVAELKGSFAIDAQVSAQIKTAGITQNNLDTLFELMDETW